MKNSQSLFSRVTKGSIWLGAGSGIENALRLLRNMILARILIPDAFGVMAILLAVYSLFDAFTQVGINTAIIQSSEGEEETFLNGAFWFAFGRAVMLFIVSFFLAPFIANFYGDPGLTLKLRVIFISLFLINIISPKAYVAFKKLDFKKWIMIEQLGGVIGIVTAIILSFVLKNIWALIFGFITEAAACAILSYIICPYIPRFKFKKENLHSLFKFTRGMFGIPIFTFIFMNIDIFVLGKVVSAEQVGYYSMALSLAKVPFTLLSKMVIPLFMPTFSEIKDDIERVNRVLLTITRILCFIAIPSVFFIACYGKSVIEMIYTPEYAIVAIPFAILFAAQILYSINSPIAPNYLAIGKPGALRITTIFRAVLIGSLIYPATVFGGLIGTALAVLASIITYYVFQIFILNRVTKINIWHYYSQFVQPTLCSIPILLLWLLQKSFLKNDDILSLVIGIVSLAFAYIACAFFYFKKMKKKLNEL